MQLWRPTGLIELSLVYDTGMRAWPARLPGQPIFYPVLNEPYAEQIARDWNTKESPFAGYVTRFQVPEEYGLKFERHVVGSDEHQELWVPAEQLPEFNRQIVGPISVESAYFGESFRGHIPDQAGFRGRDALGQLLVLAGSYEYSLMDFHCEISANHKAVFLNYPYWRCCSLRGAGLSEEQRERVLSMVQTIWAEVERVGRLVDRAQRAV